jgi:hypothetical protein
MSTVISYDEPNYRIYFGPYFENKEYNYVKENSIYKYMVQPGSLSGYKETFDLTESYGNFLKEFLLKQTDINIINEACISLFNMFYYTLLNYQKEKINSYKKSNKNMNLSKMKNFFENYMKSKIEEAFKVPVPNKDPSSALMSYVDVDKKYKISKSNILAYLYVKLYKRNMYSTCAYIYYVKRKKFLTGKDEINFIGIINLNKIYTLSRDFFNKNKIQDILIYYHNILKFAVKNNFVKTISKLNDMKKDVQNAEYNGIDFMYYTIKENIRKVNYHILIEMNEHSNINDIKKFIEKFNSLLLNLSHSYDTIIIVDWVYNNLFQFNKEESNKIINNNINNNRLNNTIDKIRNIDDFIYVSKKITEKNNSLFNNLKNKNINNNKIHLKYCVYTIMSELIQCVLRNTLYSCFEDRMYMLNILLSIGKNIKEDTSNEFIKDINQYYINQCYGTSYFYQFQ